MKLANLAVAARMRLLIGMMLLGLSALCAVSLTSLRTTMIEDRKVQTRHQVESGASILKHFHALAQAGSLSEADARKAATEALRAVRYDGNNYLFVVGTDNHYVLLPPKPEMEGRDASGLKDTNGKHIIQEIVKAGTAGGGYIDYWFPKPGADAPQPKISYAMAFAPWGWVIGTGIYVDDVDREFRAIALTLGGISLALLTRWGCSAGGSARA